LVRNFYYYIEEAYWKKYKENLLIKNPDILEQFEKERIREEKLSFRKASKIFEAMWKEGVSLGVLPPKNPLEGIEIDIKVARILNCSKKS